MDVIQRFWKKVQLYWFIIQLYIFVQPKMFNNESSTVYKNIKSKNLNKNCKPIFKTNLLVQTFLEPLQNLNKILEKPKAFNFY